MLTGPGAKGLEAPILFLAAAGPRGNDPTDPLLFEPEDGLPLWRCAKGDADPVAASALEAEKQRLADEGRRLLYVALTRARDRLYVTGWKHARESKSSTPSWHDLVAKALDGLSGVEVVAEHGLGPHFAGPIRRHASGQPVTAPAPAAAVPVHPPPPEWLAHPVQPESPPPRPLAPSRAMALEKGEGLGSAAADARRHGILVHKLLELLPALPPDDREAAAERYLHLTAPDLDASARSTLVDECRAVMAMPEVAAAFAPDALVEQELCGTVGGSPVRGRVDRLAVTADEVLLVDFKTGIPPTGSGPSPYRQQLRLYAQLLAELYPDRPVRAFILWTAAPRLEPVETSPPVIAPRTTALEPHGHLGRGA